MTTAIIPGIALKPLSGAASLSCAHRVLHVRASDDLAVLIPIEPNRSNGRLYFVGPVTASLTGLQQELDDLECPKLAIAKVKPRPDAWATDEELDAKYCHKGQTHCAARKERERRWKLIEPLVSNYDDVVLLFDRQLRQELILKRALQLTDSRKKLRRLRIEIRDCLHQYWAGGSKKGSLTPYRAACGAPGKEKPQRRKLGRKNAPTRAGQKGREGFPLSEHDKEIIRFSWRSYYLRGTTIKKAYRKMGREFYSILVTDATGKTTPRLLPAHQRPTVDQFRRWGSQQSPEEAAWKKQLSKTNLARIDRAIMGNANDDVVAVGQRASVDSTSPDMHFVSTLSRLDRIGTAYRILVVDSLYRYIPGFYLGLHAPSAETVKLAFLHAMSPKGTWLRFLGLDEQSAEDWIPIAFSSVIADNTDARAEQVFISLDAIGTGQFYIPVARSDLNSAAEVSHHQLHRMVDHNMHGSTHGRRTSERMEDRADDLARHTIIEAIRETSRAIHMHNTMPLDIKNPTLEMQRLLLDKGLPLTRLNLTRMRMDQGKVARALMDIDEARVHLMPITRGTFTAKGVKLLRPDTGQKRVYIEPVRYVSRHPLMVEWFIRAKNERSKQAIDFYDHDFRYDPYNPGTIYFRNSRDGELIALEARSDDREMLFECSYYDILHNVDHYSVYRHDNVEARDQALSRMEVGQEETKFGAQNAYDDDLAAKDTKPSKAKLRGNKTQNREREDALYQFGMPIPPIEAEATTMDESPANMAQPSKEKCVMSSPGSGDTAAEVSTAPSASAKHRSSIFMNAIRNRKDQGDGHVRR